MQSITTFLLERGVFLMPVTTFGQELHCSKIYFNFNFNPKLSFESAHKSNCKSDLYCDKKINYFKRKYTII